MESFRLGISWSDPTCRRLVIPTARGEEAALPRASTTSVQELWKQILKAEAARLDLENWKKDQEVTTEDVRTAASLILRLISARPLSPNLAKPCLVIGDFAWRNIICNPTTGRVIGFIDLQGVAVLPRFMPARYPDDISSTHSTTDQWLTTTGGFPWVPPDDTLQIMEAPECGQEGVDWQAGLRKAMKEELVYRKEFRLHLSRNHPLFQERFWREAQHPLKLHFLLVYGI
ncbi:hypothetical protein DACRYDRAFT_108963 [Dacryopinax primogenitus]|uniref:Uncharacterized protein n=1 Tax=Dacryopinax primogenitus (strain DJM 731) TaxID=1858805 RepID=M5FS85_DACPD|nr:uncharacterized protein DACRYDRAFT_108963 [Dacryopinax primogenitus]EJU00216.1 hypothetical protein DACRYDRAFT_108963 [Dacryopinax primogenitus]